MFSNLQTSRKFLIAIAMTTAAAASANAATFQPSIARWTAIHTEAPSHFSAPITLSRFTTTPRSPGYTTFSAPAVGPAGAQFGYLPYNNHSFIDPTRNSVQAHQTQNSVQASNTMESSQAVQGRNCSLNAIRAGLCQGR